MKATNWEFTNRALIFGLIFGCSFSLYFFDRQMSTAVAANWLIGRLQMDLDLVVHLLLGIAAFLLIAAVLIRTWASAYLNAGVIYASEVKTESLVADGPYRRVRNPLYFANVLMAVGMGALMSRPGFVLAVTAMTIFCYRLILREESELLISQGVPYQNYCRAVPRMLPSPWPRIASAGHRPQWAEGIKVESWYWGFALAVSAFAITLNVKLFFVILGASLALFWVMSIVMQKKAEDPRSHH